MTPRNPDLAEHRARASMAAAELLLSHKQFISDLCNWAQADDVVLAVIMRDLTFGGAITVPLSQLREQVLSLQESGWALLFSPGDIEADIEVRCAKMVGLAEARLDAIRRWREKHPVQDR